MQVIIAASYGRTSKEKDDAFSVDSQLKANNVFADLHGLTVPDNYSFPEDFTGRLLDRPALNKIRELMKEKKIQALIVYATDRLARKVGVADLLLDELFEYGVTLYIVAWGTHVRDTPEDRMRFNFESTYADFERRKIMERTTRGKRQKLEGGIYLGNGYPPFGYQKVGRKRETKLVIIEEEAKIIRLIYVWYAVEHISVTEIRRRLRGEASPGDTKGYREKGIKVREIGDWPEMTIYKILRNPTYKGAMESFGYTLDVPVIIEPAIWALAAERLTEGRTMSPRGQKYEYLMARRTRCRLCDYAVMTTPTLRRGELAALYYRCSSVRNQTARRQCSLPRFRVDQVDEVVWTLVRELILDPPGLRRMLEESQTELIAKYGDLKERLERTEKRLEKERKRLAVLLVEYADNQAQNDEEEKDEAKQYVAEVYRRAKEEAEETVRELLKERTDVASQLEKLTVPDGLIEDIEEFALSARDDIDNLPFTGRRALIESMGFKAELAIEDGKKVVYIIWYTHTFRRVLPVSTPRRMA
jgi:site-specific DNA recombinase